MRPTTATLARTARSWPGRDRPPDHDLKVISSRLVAAPGEADFVLAVEIGP